MLNRLTLKDLYKKVPLPVFEIAQRLKENAYSAYLVGGSIRDILLGSNPHDFDIATNATPDILLDLFPKSIEVGAKFGTVIVLSSPLGLNDTTLQNEEYQVTTFRKDARYINGRWPESVEFSKTIHDDLSRRDFTINAIAADILKIEENKDSEDKDLKEFIIDDFNGLEDLEKGIIKAVGDPIERMKEDGLRSMRACRLASKLEFVIETETFTAIKAASTTIDQVSMERIRDEFLKTLETQTPSIGLELMRRAGIIEKFIPELLEGVGLEQNEFHVHDLYTHLLRTCDVAPTKIRLAALLHDVGKSRTKQGPHFYGHESVGALMVREILSRLRMPKYDIEHISKLIELHMFNYLPEWSDGAVRRFLNKVGDDKTLEDLFLLRIADATANPKTEYDPNNLKELERRIAKVKEEDNALSLKDLKINGYDIMDLGIKDGREIGKTLNMLLEKVLDDPTLNDKDKLTQLVKGGLI